ncbi:hypothetical protein HEQ72_08795 [Haematospirillum sp. 15-248]|uniref:hypothetical protein n=1 Tax=Haematospirillum sp. 15-248 TaxID=2723107 RepID=UPI001438B2BA|nr:hypothetical protein [Haematospirillum sp. 15-248]NKD88406.1 hypothetical protein [Haematospirillum sp. 15-248]
MAFVEWSVYALRLKRCAERMSRARTVEELRVCVAENTQLWAQLDELLSERLEARCADCRTLHNRARYVAETSAVIPTLSDSHIEAFIAINRQSAEILPMLDLSADINPVRN